MSSAERVDREDVPVAFVCSDDDHIQEAWAELESRIPLRGNAFFGAFWPETQEYWACVRSGERVEGLEHGTLPGGAYLRERLRGEPPGLYEQILPCVHRLDTAAGDTVDASRPTIEHYRRHDELDVFVAVSPTA
ncbi:MAG TPA: hypothetical protein VI408_11845 [Gaiellaceae bacterium]